MDKRIATFVGAAFVLAGATAVVAQTGFFASEPPAPACPADPERESGDRAALLSNKPLAISANRLTVVQTGRVLDPQSCVETDGMLRHLSVLPGTGAAFVVDQAGQDVLTVVRSGSTTPVASGIEITHPSWSPMGRLAWSENLEVIKVMSPDGSAIDGVVLPHGSVAAFSPLFIDEDRLLAVVQENVKGAPPEDESLNNLWTFDLSSGKWAPRTSFDVSGDNWIGIRTPVMGDDGSIYFVRVSANASRTEEPRFQLWRYAGGAASKVRSLESEMYLAGMADGRLIWNAPSRACNDWGLFVEHSDGLDEIGCGAVMTDPVTMADPDQLVDAHADEVAPETDELTDLVIVIGDFDDKRAAARVAGDLDRPARVIGHDGAPSALRPGSWGVLVQVAAGVPVDEDLEIVRGQLSGCDCGAWLAPSV
jgi:hypothetical protein